MKIYEISRERLVAFYETQPGREALDKATARYFCDELKKDDAQVILVKLINAWMTAYNAEMRAKKDVERITFELSCECALNYIVNALSKSADKYVDRLYVFRTLDETWQHFKAIKQ